MLRGCPLYQAHSCSSAALSVASSKCYAYLPFIQRLTQEGALANAHSRSAPTALLHRLAIHMRVHTHRASPAEEALCGHPSKISYLAHHLEIVQLNSSVTHTCHSNEGSHTACLTSRRSAVQAPVQDQRHLEIVDAHLGHGCVAGIGHGDACEHNIHCTHCRAGMGVWLGSIMAMTERKVNHRIGQGWVVLPSGQ